MSQKKTAIFHPRPPQRAPHDLPETPPPRRLAGIDASDTTAPGVPAGAPKAMSRPSVGPGTRRRTTTMLQIARCLTSSEPENAHTPLHRSSALPHLPVGITYPSYPLPFPTATAHEVRKRPKVCVMLCRLDARPLQPASVGPESPANNAAGEQKLCRGGSPTRPHAVAGSSSLAAVYWRGTVWSGRG